MDSTLPTPCPPVKTPAYILARCHAGFTSSGPPTSHVMTSPLPTFHLPTSDPFSDWDLHSVLDHRSPQTKTSKKRSHASVKTLPTVSSTPETTAIKTTTQLFMPVAIEKLLPTYSPWSLPTASTTLEQPSVSYSSNGTPLQTSCHISSTFYIPSATVHTSWPVKRTKTLVLRLSTVHNIYAPLSRTTYYTNARTKNYPASKLNTKCVRPLTQSHPGSENIKK